MLVCEQLPKQPTAPAQARRLLASFDDQVPAACLEDARLLVSEIVTNAVEHVGADGEIEVRMELEDGLLRVEVLDPGEGFEWRPRESDNPRGWGLHFVQRLSDRWGVTAEECNRVWFELTA